METNHHFGCTRCGGCCQGWRLPLSLNEANRWTSAGHRVEVLAQAQPAMPVSGRKTWQDGFPAVIGGVAMTVTVVLTADLGPACPHLRPDHACANHAGRPLACRIYPAGLDPDFPSLPGQKRCPPEAWAAGSPLLAADGACVDSGYRRDRDAFLAAMAADLEHMPRLCTLIRLRHVGLAGRGCVIHRPPHHRMSAALRLIGRRPGGPLVPGPDWVVVDAAAPHPPVHNGEYLPLDRDTPARA